VAGGRRGPEGETEGQQKPEDRRLRLHLIDARAEFAKDYLFPVLKAGAVYEHEYLLGTATARPLIARKQVEVALATGCDGLSHGCTGKGNDQVRFELTYQALAPELAIIAPWREWEIRSREDAIDYAAARGIRDGDKRSRTPDRNPGTVTKGPSRDGLEPKGRCSDRRPGEGAGHGGARDHRLRQVSRLGQWREACLVAPIEAPNESAERRRADRFAENRFIGIKSRGVYGRRARSRRGAPGARVVTLDRTRTKARLGHATQTRLLASGSLARGARRLHDGPHADGHRQRHAKLYKGSCIVVGRTSPYALYSTSLASFDMTGFTPKDSEGFIRLFGLPTKGRERLSKNGKPYQAVVGGEG
jgi:argininosuccinate synthase